MISKFSVWFLLVGSAFSCNLYSMDYATVKDKIATRYEENEELQRVLQGQKIKYELRTLDCIDRVGLLCLCLCVGMYVGSNVWLLLFHPEDWNMYNLNPWNIL